MAGQAMGSRLEETVFLLAYREGECVGGENSKNVQGTAPDSSVYSCRLYQLSLFFTKLRKREKVGPLAPREHTLGSGSVQQNYRPCMLARC